MANLVQQHTVHLHGEKTRLRPFTDADIPIAWRWNQDAEVLYYAEGDEVTERTLEDVKGIYRLMSQQGYLFIIETGDGVPIGEVCLQWMNLERADVKPGEQVMRLPIMIGERSYWGKGYGKDVISTLMRYAFLELKIDRLCAMGVSAFNARSLGMFSSLGFREACRLKGAVKRGMAQFDEIDLEITREKFIEGID
ncbi:GNAT family N-acetyltransferase [Candidatus Poribacteria bacterium]|nr:GNAT family N-acetyltransferase [Candidatus Poribacteria bacterium]